MLARLTFLERVGVGLLILLLVAFGAVVEIRSAFQKARHTDFGVYSRAAWAVRTGGDLYGITDDRTWHYCYPPPFAIAMTPLADPPAGESRIGYLPFAMSVGIWYLLSLGCVWFTLNRFANAILPHEDPGSRRWYYARSGPFLIAIGGIGYTLARGQVNLLVVAMLAGLFTEWIRHRRLTAGVWLAAAISVKVIPALLGVLWLLKRDSRAVGGTVVGLVLALVVLPATIWGLDGSLKLNQQMMTAVLQPGAMGSGDQTRQEELTGATSTDSQSFQAAIHNLLHPDPLTRPAVYAPETRLAHWAIGGAILLVIVVLAIRRASNDPADDLVLLGSLSVVMLHLTPVSHMHYYAYALPLVCGIWLRDVREHPSRVVPTLTTLGVLIAWGIATALPLFPGAIFDVLRSGTFGVAASMLLLVFANRSQTRLAVEPVACEVPMRRAA